MLFRSQLFLSSPRPHQTDLVVLEALHILHIVHKKSLCIFCILCICTMCVCLFCFCFNNCYIVFVYLLKDIYSIPGELNSVVIVQVYLLL